MKKILLSILLSLFPQAYSQEEAAQSPAPAPSEEVDPAQAIKNNFAVGPYDRKGKYNPSANKPEEKYQQQAMEETPELMEAPKEDN